MAAKGQIKYTSRDTDLAWAIITAVCARYRVEPMVMCSHDRRLHVAFARQIAMYLIRGMTNMSSPAIGSFSSTTTRPCSGRRRSSRRAWWRGRR